jgi:hypothetical protein
LKLGHHGIVIKTHEFCNRRIASLNHREKIQVMSIDKNKVTTQDELNEPAPMDQVEARVEKEMKELERKAKKDVREGLNSTDDEGKQNRG